MITERERERDDIYTKPLWIVENISTKKKTFKSALKLARAEVADMPAEVFSESIYRLSIGFFL
jgi:hypothetical protein